MVYLGPVEKITAKGPKTYEYYLASWKDGFRSPRYAYLRDGLVKAELVRGNSPRHLSGLDRLTCVPLSALFGSNKQSKTESCTERGRWHPASRRGRRTG